MEESNKIKEQDILDFLLVTDFNRSVYSYTELLEFLKHFKYLYRETFESKRQLRICIEQNELTLMRLVDEIEQNESILIEKEKQLKNLLNRFNRKLTWKERIFGRLDL